MNWQINIYIYILCSIIFYEYMYEYVLLFRKQSSPPPYHLSSSPKRHNALSVVVCVCCVHLTDVTSNQLVPIVNKNKKIPVIDRYGGSQGSTYFICSRTYGTVFYYKRERERELLYIDASVSSSGGIFVSHL